MSLLHTVSRSIPSTSQLTLQLLKLAGLGDLRVQVELASIEVSKEAIVVGGTNGKEHLGPSEGRNGINCGNTVGNIGAGKTRGNVEGESEDFRDNVSDDGELGNWGTRREEATVS